MKNTTCTFIVIHSRITRCIKFRKLNLLSLMCLTTLARTHTGYVDGDNKNGESELAGKKFFNSENEFRPAEFMHFCSKMLVKEPKETGKAPCMLLFCSFEQQFQFIELGKKYGLPNYINLVFRKNFSAQVLKANMRIVGNCEYGFSIVINYRNLTTSAKW